MNPSRCVKARPNFVLIPNMPDRGVAADYSWLRGSIPDGELQKIQAGATDRPQAAATCGIQATQPEEDVGGRREDHGRH